MISVLITKHYIFPFLVINVDQTAYIRVAL